ncbi:MAG: GNAT family N-acetyltransferase [Myxococcales bacterium]|nr:GNAT family N-acetyltransferase [Myxococcales bacterium]
MAAVRLSPTPIVNAGAPALELRSPEPQDAAVMLEFLRRLLHESSEYLNAPNDRYDSMSEDALAERLVRLAQSDREFYMTAFEGECVVGNLLFSAYDIPVSLHCGQLAMGVLQSHQGQGIASAMLSRCIEEARKLAVWNLRFTVRTYNHRAVALYERHGFRRVGRLERVAQIGGAFVDEFLYQGVFGGPSDSD